MTLKEIDKKRYHRHLRAVFAGIVLALVIISITTSTVAIYLFSSPDVSHFLYNLAGVIFAAIVVFIILNKLRQHPYMYEVVYVWDLKQQLNRINRKVRKIEAAVKNNDKNALIIMNFMYQGSKQLYELDDNTITMDSLINKIIFLEQRIENSGLDLSERVYDQAMLDQFSLKD